MTQTATQAANYEAKIALIQMGVKQFNDTVFIAPSCTSNTPHIVTVVDGKVTFCSECKGFSFAGHCAHGIAVLRFIAEEDAKAEQQAQAALLAERERYLEFEFQMGSYSIPGLY